MPTTSRLLVVATMQTWRADELAAAAGAGYEPAMGARPLRRALTRHIEDPVSEMILFGDAPEGTTVTVDHIDGAGFSFTAGWPTP